MKKAAIAASVALLFLLTGCLPVASLQMARPLNGHGVTFGLTAVTGIGDQPSVAALPYVAYAWGNGSTEFSVSTQVGLRGGVKQQIASGVSIAGGLTIPWLIFSEGMSFTADAALLYEPTPGLTLAGRGMYAYLGAELGNAWLGGASLTYAYQGWLFEGGLLFSQEGRPLFSVSAAYHF